MTESGPQYNQDRAHVALNFLAAVEDQFAGCPEHYKRFLGYMTQYNRKEITPLYLVDKVTALLFKYQNLIDGFNAFIPTGWQVSSVPDDTSIYGWVVTITNEEGTFVRKYSEVPAGEAQEHDESSNEEFRQMVALVANIKERYAQNPAVYEEFLRLIDPNRNSGSREQIFVTVKELLHDSPDLIDRFQVLVIEG